jgi:hypothetical protein
MICCSFSKKKGGHMKKITVAVAIGICLIASIIVGFPRYGEAEVIYGCYGKIAGVLRIVDSPNKCTRLEIPITWNSEGPQGPVGPAGPAGPTGPPGSGGIVAQVCPVGEVVAGFDDNGNIICVPRGWPLPPVFTNVTGPFNDFGQLLCNIPVINSVYGELYGTCLNGLAFFNQLARYEVSGKAEPRTKLTFYLSGDCSGDAHALKSALSQLCEDNLGPNPCMFLIPMIEDFFNVWPSTSGDFTATLVTVGTVATVSATTNFPSQATAEQSDCSAPLTLP